jgi:polyisoprenoid-binding protein YceI
MTWAQSPTDVAVFKIIPVKCTMRFGVKAGVPIEGVFDKWDSTLTFTSNHAEGAVLDVKIQAKSLDTGSAMENEKLNSKDFFDVEHSPYITFHSNWLCRPARTPLMSKGHSRYVVCRRLKRCM